MLQALLLAPLRLLYAAWAVAAFLVAGLSTLVLLLVLPRMQQRRAAARALARAFLAVAGMPLTVKFPERIPDGPVRGRLQPRQLPRRRRAHRRAAAALRLRDQARDGARSARRTPAAATRFAVRRALQPPSQRRGCPSRAAQRDQGSSLVFFPEGTFTRTPGLLKFHPGRSSPRCARVARWCRPWCAARAAALPPSGALPVPGRIELEILPPLGTGGGGRRSGGRAAATRAARNAILAALGEPDLTCCDDTGRPPHRARARSVPASRP